MVRPANAKVWNEDLVRALQARADQARQQGKRAHITWQQGADAIERVRQDIYQFKTGRIVNLPTNLAKTIDNCCRGIIEGHLAILPDGYVPNDQAIPMDNHHYLHKIKIRGGAFAILLAFYTSHSSTLTRDQILQAAQPYCDEAMDSSYMQGRTYGAWKANETLIKHGFLSREKARVAWNERARGLRAQGKNSYTLTRDGEAFTEALLRIRCPNLQIQRGSAFGGSVVAGVGSGAARAAAPVARHSSPPTARTQTLRPPKNYNMRKDEDTLREWVRAANVGDKKEFKVGKDRRKRLHDVCDDINRNLLVGRRLQHESTGHSNSRTLTIKLLEDETNASGAFSDAVAKDDPFSVLSPARTPTDAFDSLQLTSASKRSHDESSDIDTKRLRTPAKLAAAEAAMVRQALFESTQMAAAKKPSPKSDKTREASNTHDDVIEIDLVVEPEEKLPEKLKPQKLDWSGSKPPAKAATNSKPISQSTGKPPAAASKPTSQVMLNLFDDDDDSDDELLNARPVFKSAKEKTKRTIEDDDDDEEEEEVVDLTESQESVLVVEQPSVATVPTVPTCPSVNLTILIDNRERVLNAKPRHLRMELNRMLQSGPLAMAWPANVPTPPVQEQELASGDFAFLVGQGGSAKKRQVPVLVERKSINDLVQRSSGMDHWRQLQRMRDTAPVSIFLLEGDFRNASNFIPFGSQDKESLSPRIHTIEDQSSLIRFIGRAIHFSNPVRFIQTKDEQGSLRAVAALGLMASTCEKSLDDLIVSDLNMKDEHQQLMDRLVKGGIPWQLAQTVAREIGSVKQMDLLYTNVDSEDCRNRLLVSVILDACKEMESKSSATAWSEAINRVYFSPLPDPATAKSSFESLQHLVEDHAALIANLHSGKPPDEALDATLSQSPIVDTARIVNVQLSTEFKGCLPEVSEEGAFYRLSEVKSPSALPLIRMRTISGQLSSSSLQIFVVEGRELVRRLNDALEKRSDCVAAARMAAQKLAKECSTKAQDKSILLLRGLHPAFDASARGRDHRQELRSVADMLMSELMVQHDIVVLQAQRLKDDLEIMIRELALSCFLFQFLTESHNG